MSFWLQEKCLHLVRRHSQNPFSAALKGLVATLWIRKEPHPKIIYHFLYKWFKTSSMVNFQIIKKLFVNPVKNKTAGPKWVAYAKPHFTKPRLSNSFSCPETESSARLSEQPRRDSFSRLPDRPLPSWPLKEGDLDTTNLLFAGIAFLSGSLLPVVPFHTAPQSPFLAAGLGAADFVNHRIKSVKMSIYSVNLLFYTPKLFF